MSVQLKNSAPSALSCRVPGALGARKIELGARKIALGTRKIALMLGKLHWVRGGLYWVRGVRKIAASANGVPS